MTLVNKIIQASGAQEKSVFKSMDVATALAFWCRGKWDVGTNQPKKGFELDKGLHFTM